jgi:hypothetical protein
MKNPKTPSELVMRQHAIRRQSAAWREVMAAGQKLVTNGVLRRKLLADLMILVEQAVKLERDNAA